MQLVVGGIPLGIAGALALTRMASLLYGVSPTDPATSSRDRWQDRIKACLPQLQRLLPRPKLWAIPSSV
jgi:hypothetical protein